MTILIGLLCEGGAVVGTDSSATFSDVEPTVEQPTTKLFKVGSDVLIAGTGSVGMMQRFSHHVEKTRTDHNFVIKDRFFTSSLVCKKTVEDFANTHAKPGTFGALMAFPSQEGCQVCEFGIADFQPEFKSGETWFVAMGSGQRIVDPFLGLMRRVFFDGGRPALSEGIFVTLSALRHAIELNTGGINEPAVIGVIEKQTPGAPWKARILSDSDLQEHYGNIEEAEKYIGEYRPRLSGKTTPTPPQTTPPPKPSA